MNTHRDPLTATVVADINATAAAAAESTDESLHATSTGAKDEPPAQKLTPLATHYLNLAIQSAMRDPSANLKNADFRAEIAADRDLIKAACKQMGGEFEGFTSAIVAKGQADDLMGCVRLVDRTQRQVLWAASLDVWKDRNPPSDLQEPPIGLIGAANNEDAIMGFGGDQERSTVTEEDAIDALVLCNGWLSTLLSIVVINENELAAFKLDRGLPFTQDKVVNGVVTEWVPVYEPEDAIELQLARNEERMKVRRSNAIAKRSKTLEALAKMAAPKPATPAKEPATA